MATHLIYKVGHSKPPEDGAEEYREVARNVVIAKKLGRKKIEARKKAYYQEENQGIGECEEKPGDEIFPEIS